MDGLIGLTSQLLETDDVSLNNIACQVDGVNIKKNPNRDKLLDNA